jgi:putative membrane protein
VLIRHDECKNARALLVADLVAALRRRVLVVWLLRVFFFEKGAAYYFHSVPFLAKLTLFVLVALLSIYPTREFLSWRQSLKEGARRSWTRSSSEHPLGAARRARAIVLLVLNAALMAEHRVRRVRIGLVIFDCDGVLVDSEPIANRVLVEQLHGSAFRFPNPR